MKILIIVSRGGATFYTSTAAEGKVEVPMYKIFIYSTLCIAVYISFETKCLSF